MAKHLELCKDSKSQRRINSLRWNFRKSRFGNKQQIINDHMAALLHLQNHPNEKVAHLRYILDSITIHVRGLESLGMPSERYGSLLTPIIMNRMPKEITSQVARKITQ